MANATWADLTVEFDNAAGTLQNISNNVLTINGINIKAEVQDVTGAGLGYVKKLFAGLLSAEQVTLGLLYDDAVAPASDALFNDPGCKNTTAGTRTLKVTWRGAKATSVETIITSYSRQPKKGELTMCEVTLDPTGTIGEA